MNGERICCDLLWSPKPVNTGPTFSFSVQNDKIPAGTLVDCEAHTPSMCKLAVLSSDHIDIPPPNNIFLSYYDAFPPR